MKDAAVRKVSTHLCYFIQKHYEIMPLPKTSFFSF